VLAHDPQLRQVELARLLQDAVGDRDLAEVVQQAGQPHLLDRLVRPGPSPGRCPPPRRDTDWLWAPA